MSGDKPKNAPATPDLVLPIPVRPLTISQPEIRLAYTPAGRETLEAITDELAPLPLPVAFDESSSPEIIVHETVAERETLLAIMQEASSADAGREQPVAADAATSEAERGAPAEDADSLAVTRPRIVPRPTEAVTALEILELSTFVVRGADAERLADETQRRRFVEAHLLKRLPVTSIDAVERIDVAPWTAHGAVIVRILCKLVT